MHAVRTATILAILSACMAGCATLSKGECYTADWYQLGRSDGASGYTRARLFDHYEACAPYGVQPNQDAYYAGRQVGLKHYCTAHHGFIEGRNGNPYRNVCRPSRETAFLSAYRDGKILYEVEEEIEDAERAIDRYEARLNDDETEDAARDDIRDQLRDALRDLRYLNRKLIRLQQRYGRDRPWPD